MERLSANEKLSLGEYALFLKEDIFLIGEEREKLLFSERMKLRTATLPSERLLVNEPVEDVEDEAYQLPYEGGFRKQVLVIHTGTTIELDSREFLIKILEAVSCTLADIGIVSEKNLKTAGEEGFLSLNPKKVLIFGRLNHPIQAVQSTNYEITEYGESEIIFADTLEDIKSTTDLKRKLWNSLQLLFNIKK